MKRILFGRGGSPSTLFNRLTLLIGLLVGGLLPHHTAQATELPAWTLPIPADETWEIIQGYNCGTHDGWGRLSFDLVNADGRTQGAPVRAAADGEFWYWVPESGTLLLKHHDGYFTMYTHLQSHIELPRGTMIQRGREIGTVGNVGAEHTVPHLHFTIFKQAEKGQTNRQPVALAFREGYAFPDDGSCNQYGGTTITAPADPAATVIPPKPLSLPIKRIFCHPTLQALGFACAE